MNNGQWQPGISGNPHGRPRINRRVSHYVTLVTKRLLKGKQLDNLYAKLKPGEQAIFIQALMKYGLESQALESAEMGLEGMDENLLKEFHQFLLSRHQAVTIELSPDYEQEKIN
jgi:hypothetical protein